MTLEKLANYLEPYFYLKVHSKEIQGELKYEYKSNLTNLCRWLFV